MIEQKRLHECLRAFGFAMTIIFIYKAIVKTQVLEVNR